MRENIIRGRWFGRKISKKRILVKFRRIFDFSDRNYKRIMKARREKIIKDEIFKIAEEIAGRKGISISLNPQDRGREGIVYIPIDVFENLKENLVRRTIHPGMLHSRIEKLIENWMIR